MPGSVEYCVEQKPQIVHFPNPRATLPILKKSGAIEFLPWGRRKEDDGLLPAGGWAKHSSIKEGVWARYHPQPVKLLLSAWSEKDDQGQRHWFSLKDQQCLQGLVAHLGTEKRVYLVTVGATDTSAIHDRAPRIIETDKPRSFCPGKKHSVSDQAAKANAQPTAPSNLDSTAIKQPIHPWPAGLSEARLTLLEFFRLGGEGSHEAVAAEAQLRQRLRRA